MSKGSPDKEDTTEEDAIAKGAGALLKQGCAKMGTVSRRL